MDNIIRQRNDALSLKNSDMLAFAFFADVVLMFLLTHIALLEFSGFQQIIA